MRLIPSISLRAISLALLPLAAACAAGGPSDGETSASQAAHATGSPAVGARLERTLKVGDSTRLSLQTLPGAHCVIHPAGVDDEDHRAALEADDDGWVSFHVTQSDATGADAVHLALDCADDAGHTVTHAVDVHADAVGDNVPDARPAHASTGTLRPALTGDLSAPTQAELVSHGYPRRPDPVKQPARYAKWVAMVTRDSTIVSPRKVAHPERSHAFSPNRELPSADFGAATSPNWSGAVMSNPQEQFWQIQSDWNVPGIQSVTSGVAAAAEWIGLDDAGNDLFQSGTASVSFAFFGTAVTGYDTWIESLPASPYYLPNFTTEAGDEISVDIFLADQYGTTWFSNGSNGRITPQDNSVWFMIYNTTRNLSYWGTEPSTNFTGSFAEYIIEKNEPQLADFTIAAMHDCWYMDSVWGDSVSESLDYNGSAPNDGILTTNTMIGSSGDTLAAAFVYPSDPDGGGNVLWIWENAQ